MADFAVADETRSSAARGFPGLHLVWWEKVEGEMEMAETRDDAGPVVAAADLGREGSVGAFRVVWEKIEGKQ